MEVGEKVKAYWCVRDFDSPRWWIIQVCNFQYPESTNRLIPDNQLAHRAFNPHKRAENEIVVNQN